MIVLFSFKLYLYIDVKLVIYNPFHQTCQEGKLYDFNYNYMMFCDDLPYINFFFSC